jgi:DMSO/TMAO reductase YedYZ molybdopterin-dependent catalytic subunit
METPLPPGQRAIGQFARFGMFQYADRIITDAQLKLKITVAGAAPVVSDAAVFEQLQRTNQTSNFHCVTTWSVRGVKWSGWRFSDFYNQNIDPNTPYDPDGWVVFYGADGFKCVMLLADLMEPDVLLADCVNDEPLGWQHGGPLRLVAPAHYGYKNAKHLCGIEFGTKLKEYKQGSLPWQEHPRARVAPEERGQFFPTWLHRAMNRAAISAALYWFDRAARRHFRSKER